MWRSVTTSKRTTCDWAARAGTLDEVVGHQAFAALRKFLQSTKVVFETVNVCDRFAHHLHATSFPCTLAAEAGPNKPTHAHSQQHIAKLYTL